MAHGLTQSSLQTELADRLVVPGAADFDASRQIWNAAINRHPAAIARCRSAADVQLALATAREHTLPISVRGGGHNIAGSAVADRALMIDLSLMRAVQIDPEHRTARVQGGALWADVDGAAQQHGLATPGGVVSHTGVAGLTLGGGFGWLSRRYGLAVDNLLSAEVVLANGELITVAADQQADLFWAIRGAGANFGIATELTFRLHQVGPQVLFGPTFFSLSDAPAVLSAYGKVADRLPREACVWANLMTAPPAPVLAPAIHGTRVLTLMQSWIGEPQAGYEVLAPLYGGAKPLGSALAPRPYTEAQQFLDATYEHGARNYWRSHNHLALTEPMIDTLLDLATDLPSPESELLITQLGGAVSDVAANDSAFVHRGIPFMSTPGVRWHDPSQDGAMIGWLKAASDRIAEHAVAGAYVNFIAETDGGASSAYGANLAQLRQIKQRYDPGNLFRSNQNIAPG